MADMAGALSDFAVVNAAMDNRRELRDALGELVDAISDELAYEVSKSPEVQRKIRAGIAALGGEAQSYLDAWWLQ